VRVVVVVGHFDGFGRGRNAQKVSRKAGNSQRGKEDFCRESRENTRILDEADVAPACSQRDVFRACGITPSRRLAWTTARLGRSRHHEGERDYFNRRWRRRSEAIRCVGRPVRRRLRS
jgi:hypothetical protein